MLEGPQLETRMGAPGFWDRPDEAQKTVTRLKQVKKSLDGYSVPDTSCNNLLELLEMAETDRKSVV